MADYVERMYNTSLNQSDTDDDNLSDYKERYLYRSNPHNNDTDEDQLPDGYEVNNGLNPK